MNLTEAQKAWLKDIQDYLEDRQDIRDGEDGAQLPNEEMFLLTEMERVGLR